MSFRLVTLEDVKEQLVYDNALSDAQLTFRLEVASQVIMDYIGDGEIASPDLTDTNGDPLTISTLDGWTDTNGIPLTNSVGDPATDTNGDSLVPGPVRAATILAMAAWDEDRKADLITLAVKSVLMRFRTPTVV